MANLSDQPILLNRVQRVYVDTSVIGGFFDTEFDWQTAPFFAAVRAGKITAIISEIVKRELEPAPPHVRDFLDEFPQVQIERVVITDEAKELAARYISEKVVGASSLDDCTHIALATIHHADFLVSWNFKHIVNAGKIRGYNGVNLRLGYKTLEIRTPYEVINVY